MRRPPLKLSVLAITLVVALAAALYGLNWIQSPEGFQRVVLPAARQVLGASLLTADHGEITIAGALRVRGLRYEDTRRGLSLTLPEGRIDVSLASVISDGLVEITDLMLDDATLVVDPPDAPAPEAPPSEPLPDARQIAKWLEPVRFPVRLSRATARGFEITIAGPDGPRARLGPGDLQVSRGPREDDAVEMSGSVLVLVAPDDEARRYAGHLDFSLEVDHQQQGWIVGALGKAKWEFLTPELRGDQALTGELDLRLVLRDGAGAGLSLSIDGRQRREPIGQVELSIGRAGPDGRHVAGAVAIDRLSTPAVNPLLSFLNAGALASGSFYGSALAHADIDDPAFELAADLDAIEVSRVLQDGTAAPPLGLRGHLRGLWQRGHGLALEALDVKLVREALERLAVSLADPYDLGAGQGDLPTSLRVQARELEVEDLRRLLSFFGITTWRNIATGRVSGEVMAEVRRSGSDLQIEGAFGISALKLASEIFAGLPPLELKANGSWRIADFREVTIEGLDLSLVKGEHRLALGRLEGQTGGGFAEIAGSVQSDDLFRALETLELGDSAPASWLSFGALDASYQARFEPEQIVLDSVISLDGVVLQRQHEPIALPRAQIQSRVRWPRGKRDIEIPQLTINLQSESGNETIRGAAHFPPAEARPGRDATLDLVAERFGAARWFTLFGWTPPEIGGFPLTGDVVVENDGSWHVDASVDTVVEPQPGAPTTAPLDLALEFDLQRPPGAPLTFTAVLTDGDDRLRVDLAYDGAAEPRHLAISTHSARFELDRYLALRDPKAEIPLSAAQAAEAESADDAVNLEPAPPLRPPITLELDLVFDRFIYRELDFTNARVQGSHRAGVLVLELAPSQLGGGLIEGGLARTRRGDVERYELGLRTKAVQLAPLIEAASRSEESSRFRGQLDLRADLRARRRIGTPLRPQIEGDVLFRIRNGELRSSGGFVREIFKGTDLQQLVFSEADAELAVGNDRIDVVAAHMEGTAGTVDVQKGHVTLDWDADILSVLRANPGVGALNVIGLSRETLLGRIADLTTVPVEIHTTGRLGDLEYASRPLPPDVLQAAITRTGADRNLIEKLDRIFNR